MSSQKHICLIGKISLQPVISVEKLYGESQTWKELSEFQGECKVQGIMQL